MSHKKKDSRGEMLLVFGFSKKWPAYATSELDLECVYHAILQISQALAGADTAGLRGRLPKFVFMSYWWTALRKV
ncbi:uncharacterized protein LOC131165734 isoform X4 [Malania oleifera]|uniref:uncharacterized protein LOC131165734 isoform X4 n=1 Tax=Malania oleifera TaxID=397392 RepID=UPI0025AE7C94|nr:uncharacterized protein LOC131165734 isoform X4 [Malania oleifera]